MASAAVKVTPNQIAQAKNNIVRAVNQHETFIPGLSEGGVLLHVLMCLGIALEVTTEE